jgi:hypothetical protein
MKKDKKRDRITETKDNRKRERITKDQNLEPRT